MSDRGRAEFFGAPFFVMSGKSVNFAAENRKWTNLAACNHFKKC